MVPTTTPPKLPSTPPSAVTPPWPRISQHQSPGAHLGGLYVAEARIAPAPAPRSNPSSAPCSLRVWVPCATSILAMCGALIAVENDSLAGRNTSVSEVAETTLPVCRLLPRLGDTILIREPGVSGQSGVGATCAADRVGTASAAAQTI